jgi:aminoglycoside phosphotransferase (APT) family kinase protein
LGVTAANGPSTVAGGSTLADVEQLLGAHGLHLLRAWPRDENHLLLEAGRGSSTVAGQWFASVQRAAEVTRKTPGAEQLGRVVLQPGGADRRLPGLRSLLERKGAELVAHRPEKRAVVRLPASRPESGAVAYAKVVRPTVLAAVARTARAAADLPVRTPAVLEVDEGAAAVVTATLPGRTLHDLLATPAALAACRAAGRALAQLHRAPVPSGLPRHEDADERAVVRRWQQLAQVHGLAAAFPLPEGGAVEAETPDQEGEPALVHRDFHDKQVVVDADGEVGVLDFDLMALGSPLVDLANFLVHLDLRAVQGLVPDAAPLRVAVLEGYGATDALVGRLPWYERATWERLAAVYAFRPPRSMS